MTYEDLIRIAVETGTDGIDLTVYWLPGPTPICCHCAVWRTEIASRSTASAHAFGSRSSPSNCGSRS